MARLTVLSGPSGVGKGTVVARLRERHPSIWISVSCTTRSPRPGERNGVDYHFVTTEQFAAMVHAGDFLEYARFAGHWYGTPRVPVEQRLGDGAAALLEIDLQGARQVRGTMPAARLVFLAPPSREELHRRLAGRGTEATPEIAERLALAEVELAAAAEFDVVVINDDVTRAADQLAALIASD